MAWSDEARRAAAEARRLHAKKGPVTYSDRAFGEFPTPNRGYGVWAFELKADSKRKGHTLFTRMMNYSAAKKIAVSTARRVAGKTGRRVYVTKLP